MTLKHLLLVASYAVAGSLMAQTELTKPEQTEVWEPEPTVVTPATKPGDAPSDAVVLFNGINFDNWVRVADSTKTPGWKLENGTMTVVGGTGNIRTKQLFGDCQLHVEWRSPIEPNTLAGQGKGNSGLFLQGRYEVQILNSFQNRTYSNGQAGCIYKQTPPLVNACAAMGEWNTYDVIYTAPRFRANGSKETPAYITVIHNGVIIQNHTEVQGTTEYIGPPKNIAHGDSYIELQDHGNAVSYRNIWIRKI